MATIIQDGTGTGTKLKINSEHKLEALSVNVTKINHQSQAGGKAFSLGTDGPLPFTLVAGTEHALLYVKNDGEMPLVVKVCVVSQDQAGYYRLYRNPTTGTLIDSGTATTSKNFNFGSSTVFEGSIIKADVQSRTFTDGTAITYSRNPAGVQPLDFYGSVVIPKGSSFGITFDPLVATVADQVSVFFYTYYDLDH